MKRITLAALTLVSVSAFAGEKLVCNEYNRSTNKLLQKTVVLTQTGRGDIKEGEAMEFLLEVYTGAEVSEDLAVKGNVLTEDVMFNFESNDKKVSFNVYLDEMNESSLKLDGKSTNYICR